MRWRHLLMRAFSIGMMVWSAGMAYSQNYPDKPIRFITSAAGGSSDVVARLIAAQLSSSFGTLVVDNRGSGLMGAIGANAPPDGYTLLLAGPTFWAAPFFFHGLSWDPIRDFSPITLAGASPNILVVHPSLPVKSVKELIALASAKPGELNYGTGGAGSTPHLAAELFKSMAHVNMVRINYRGGGPATTGLIAGEVQVMFATASSVIPHIKSGRLKALAVSSTETTSLAPGLPTVASAGLPGYESMTLYGVFAPAKTPAALIERLNAVIVRAVNEPEAKKTFLVSGVEPIGSTPSRLAAPIKSDMALMAKVINSADQ